MSTFKATSTTAALQSKARRSGPWITVIALSILLFASICLAAAIGVVRVPYTDTMRIVIGRMLSFDLSDVRQYEAIIWSVRLPRVVTAGLVGWALGICGAAMQGFFRNPMASPGIVGLSSGASLGAVVTIFLGLAAGNQWFLPLGAFVGGLLATGVVYVLATQGGRTDTATLLLAGVALSSFFSSLISLLYHFVDDGILRQVVFWLMGNLAGKRWEHVTVLTPFVFLGSFCLWLFAKDLNMMLLGDDEARSMGVQLERTKRILIVLVSVVAGAGIAIAGMIGFVGLIVPHMLRRIIGPDHRWLLPTSALGGAILLILSDLVARTVFAPVELRPGIVTSLLGVPFFLYLLFKRKDLAQWT